MKSYGKKSHIFKWIELFLFGPLITYAPAAGLAGELGDYSMDLTEMYHIVHSDFSTKEVNELRVYIENVKQRKVAHHIVQRLEDNAMNYIQLKSRLDNELIHAFTIADRDAQLRKWITFLELSAVGLSLAKDLWLSTDFTKEQSSEDAHRKQMEDVGRVDALDAESLINVKKGEVGRSGVDSKLSQDVSDTILARIKFYSEQLPGEIICNDDFSNCHYEPPESFLNDRFSYLSESFDNYRGPVLEAAPPVSQSSSLYDEMVTERFNILADEVIGYYTAPINIPTRVFTGKSLFEWMVCKLKKPSTC